jgi:FKBP-type peptidyl-prolyl cis-trans isomerase
MLLLLASLLACTGSEPSTAPEAATATVAAPEATKASARPALDIPAPADVAAAPADAEVTATGLASKVLQAGTGTAHPTAKDKVSVNYTGWTTDGAAFDSSSKRGKPATFGLGQVIAGWTEGVQLMVVGEKRRFWIPEALAYKGKPGKPAGMLVFDVELVEIIEAPKPIPAPEDVAAPSKGAKKTKSGLSYKVITKGTGKEHPTAESTVSVEYTGWGKDGEMFDSSVTRGKPASFALGRVIPGWTEGVQLMVVGEKTRFWIPAALAYGDTPKRPGAPSGDLTFDIELKEIKAAGDMPKRAQLPVDHKKMRVPGATGGAE